MAGDPPARLVGHKGGVDAAVWPAAGRQAGLAAGQRTGASLGHGQVSPAHLLLGVLEDARQPADKVRVSRRHRQITASVGLPTGYRGAAGLLLATLQVDLDQLRAAVIAQLGGVQR